jgi:hypothetical protein
MGGRRAPRTAPAGGRLDVHWIIPAIAVAAAAAFATAVLLQYGARRKP